MRQIPPITKNLLIINVLAFLASLVMGSRGIDLNDIFGLHFVMAEDFAIYQLFTYMFMHANITHLFFNMFALWMFGCTVENAWGQNRFLFYTLACGIGAGLFQECAQFVSYAVEGFAAYDSVNIGGMIMPMGEFLNNWTTVGFSGAVYGILLGFGMTYPEERIFIFPLPVPIKGKWFVCIYAAIELFSALGTSNDNVAHVAHLGGMVIGYFIILYWKNRYNRQYRFQGWDGYEIRDNDGFFDKVKGFFSKMKENDSRKDTPKDKNDEERRRQAEIDRILDKIKRSGYDSLTTEERKKLFDRK
ncbi:rhomboid family intramembrane serine protease [Palleniella muris]|uniref:Rhomboid family intramembrane serine protease n=1 Tax=Palleniella muris TaxID=3038145 RepID=A0AC61QRV4_9BACT|nr:rhomboid family intramembrane serine protease [Palleniella muris]TGX83142.1 rhomboid family intramembrane serine protease [Palleniella muris]